MAAIRPCLIFLLAGIFTSQAAVPHFSSGFVGDLTALAAAKKYEALDDIPIRSSGALDRSSGASSRVASRALSSEALKTSFPPFDFRFVPKRPDPWLEKSQRWSNSTSAALRPGSWLRKVDEPRNLQELRPCTNSKSCEENEYCISCKKCAEYHASLPADDQARWTCDPCTDDGTHCESGKYCEVAKDAVEGTCPDSFPGCSDHSECKDDEYCYSCQKCEEYMQGSGTNESLWQCQPCPTTKGGFCSLLGWCPLRQDSITGSCPEGKGCSQHTDCSTGQYCEGCSNCEDYKQSLPEDQRPYWSCAPCPTAGGGICENERFCQVANDGIDKKCPAPKGCGAHTQCEPSKYCMDCTKCAAYHDQLPVAERDTWDCGACPTERLGYCERRMFCALANDSIGGACPVYDGCAKHGDCKSTEFCRTFAGCEEEFGAAKCGAKPLQLGFCGSGAICTSKRSIDQKCNGAMPCDSHSECMRGTFCTPWDDCNTRTPGACGVRAVHKDGVCMPTEHCIRGFHTPVDGKCPAWDMNRGIRGGTLAVSEVLKLEGSMMLATFHQAFSSWENIQLAQAPEDQVLFQLHEYGKSKSRVDDLEYVGIYKPMDGKLSEQKLIPLSCPLVELTIPAKPSLLFEARIFVSESEMAVTHAECSCVVGESVGRCPRGASFVKPISSQEGTCLEFGSVTATGSEPEQKAWLQPGQLEKLQGCQGSVEVNTTATFELRAPRSHVNYLRLDTFKLEDITLPGDITDPALHFDGDELRCESPVEHDSRCGNLPVNVSIPVVVVLIHIGPGDSDRLQSLTGTKYCATCKLALKRFHPVVFVDSTGYIQPNNLTLYSMVSDVRANAKLVSAMLGNGEGDKYTGCPWLEDELSRGPTLQRIRQQNKTLPAGHVTGKWCVVQAGNCSISAKYKFCVAGGAKGVLIMEAPEDPSATMKIPADIQGQVWLLSADEKLSDMVPVIYSTFQQDLWDLLVKDEETELAVGPYVGVRPTPGIEMSHGGVRVYDTLTGLWTEGGGGFGAVRWMETSDDREVLFACNAARRILAFDTSSPDHKLRLLGKAPESLLCEATQTFRDYHLVDFKQGNNFITVFIDAIGDRNHLLFFDTTDLSSWKKLAEVHANWEHGTEGLGQVKATIDGRLLLVTWQCSTIYCGNTPRTDGSMPGEKVYVLGMDDVLTGAAHNTPLLAAIQMPMSPGSIVRDVACDADNICLVTMSWDGVAAVDLGEGPNRFKVISEHSAAFTGWKDSKGTNITIELPAQLAHMRMVTGAQKVVSSRVQPGTFFLERWSFDADAWFLKGATLGDALRYDSIWQVAVEGYIRPGPDEGVPALQDPAVSGKLRMPSLDWSKVLEIMSLQSYDDFEDLVSDSLAAACFVASDRIQVTAAYSMNAEARRLDLAKRQLQFFEGTQVDFTILAGDGASPQTLFTALQMQLSVAGSAILTGKIAGYLRGASLEQVGPGVRGQGKQSDKDMKITSGMSQASNSEGEVSMILRLIFMLISFVVAIAAIWYAVRVRNNLNRVSAENKRLMTELAMGNGGVSIEAAYAASNEAEDVPMATGYVIGRPSPGGGTGKADPGADDKATPGAPATTYVVGNPVGPAAALPGSSAPGGGLQVPGWQN